MVSVVELLKITYTSNDTYEIGQAECALAQMQLRADFLKNLIDICLNSEVEMNIRYSAIIYIKKMIIDNKVCSLSDEKLLHLNEYFIELYMAFDGKSKVVYSLLYEYFERLKRTAVWSNTLRFLITRFNQNPKIFLLLLKALLKSVKSQRDYDENLRYIYESTYKEIITVFDSSIECDYSIFLVQIIRFFYSNRVSIDKEITLRIITRVFELINIDNEKLKGSFFILMSCMYSELELNIKKSIYKLIVHEMKHGISFKNKPKITRVLINIVKTEEIWDQIQENLQSFVFEILLELYKISDDEKDDIGSDVLIFVSYFNEFIFDYHDFRGFISRELSYLNSYRLTSYIVDLINDPPSLPEDVHFSLYYIFSHMLNTYFLFNTMNDMYELLNKSLASTSEFILAGSAIILGRIPENLVDENHILILINLLYSNSQLVQYFTILSIESLLNDTISENIRLNVINSIESAEDIVERFMSVIESLNDNTLYSSLCHMVILLKDALRSSTEGLIDVLYSQLITSEQIYFCTVLESAIWYLMITTITEQGGDHQLFDFFFTKIIKTIEIAKSASITSIIDLLIKIVYTAPKNCANFFNFFTVLELITTVDFEDYEKLFSLMKNIVIKSSNIAFQNIEMLTTLSVNFLRDSENYDLSTLSSCCGLFASVLVLNLDLDCSVILETIDLDQFIYSFEIESGSAELFALMFIRTSGQIINSFPDIERLLEKILSIQNPTVIKVLIDNHYSMFSNDFLQDLNERYLNISGCQYINVTICSIFD